MRANPNPPKAALAPRAATKKDKELHAASVVRRRFVTRSALMIVGDRQLVKRLVRSESNTC